MVISLTLISTSPLNQVWGTYNFDSLFSSPVFNDFHMIIKLCPFKFRRKHILYLSHELFLYKDTEIN